MELLQLRYFVTVAQMLNISRAAKHHMIPQPDMSRTISKLERELGVPLFDRYKNRLTLTEQGKVFYHAISHSLQGMDHAVEDIGRSEGPLTGELKIWVQQHRDTVVGCIMAFKRLHPQVSFRISYEPEPRDYRDFDLCISGQQPEESFGDSRRLITEKLKLVVSNRHWAAEAECVSFDQLREEEFATISRNANQWLQTLHHCRQAGFEPRVSITCADLHCLMKYVGAGMAITVGPEIAWRGLRREDVVFVPTSPEIERSTYVFWNAGKSVSRLSAIYRDFLVEHFHALQEEMGRNENDL